MNTLNQETDDGDAIDRHDVCGQLYKTDDYNVNVIYCIVTIIFLCLNDLFYADDSAILAPTPARLQKLLYVCENCFQAIKLFHIVDKTKCIMFFSKTYVVWSAWPSG